MRPRTPSISFKFAKTISSFSLIFLPLLSLLFFLAVIFDWLPYLRGPAPWPPEWQWPYQPPLFTQPVLIISLFLLSGFLFALQGRLPFILLSILTPLLLLAQSRSGPGVLLARLVHPERNGHLTAALSLPDPLALLSNYPQLVQTFYMHAHGHPPGITLFYQLLFLISGNLDLTLNLILLFTYLTHLLSSILIYQITKQYTKFPLLITLLWIATPAVNLFIPLPDLTYALLPLATYYFLLHRRFLLSGILIYLSLFFSLSTLPALILFLCLSFINPKNHAFLPLTRRQLLRLAAGFALPYAALSLLGFDFFSTLTTVLTTQTHRSYSLWLFPNLLDFIIYSGVPLWLFILLKYRQFSHRYILHLLLITLLLLTLSGFSRAETGRVWMPLIPPLLIALSQYPPLTRQTASTLILLQITHTIILNLFWVSLW